MKALADVFLCFLIYSFIGWLWETLLYIFRDKLVVKRGFLNGPLCPIYGCGAMICVAIFYGRGCSIAVLFLAGMLCCTALEYLTHFLLDKLFHTTWWDYSSCRFNLNGRICLQCAIGFGLCIVLLMSVHPRVLALVESIPMDVKIWLCFGLYTVLIADSALTVGALSDLDGRLKSKQSELGSLLQDGLDSAEERRADMAKRLEDNLREHELAISGTRRRSTLTEHQVRRLLRSFPRLQSRHYAEAVEWFKENAAKKKKI
ncbi:MAG: putative ABC transporter permease [Oscillospiraceae bacterium]|nr:putative ABC transporter permease [Oscillospiraceae bacterium]